MNKKDLNSALNNEKGSGLVLTLMVVLVLSVLGASLGVITVGSYRLGDNNRDSNSAYYIAEAGANRAYEEMKHYALEAYENSDSSASFFEKMETPFGVNNNQSNELYDEFETQFGDQPSATVNLTGANPKDDVKEYTIESTGEVSGKERTVKKPVAIKWQDKQNNGSLPEIPGGASVIVKNRINFIDGMIKGDTYLDSSSAGNFRMSSSGNISFDNIYSSYKENLEDIFALPDYYYDEGHQKQLQNIYGKVHKMPGEINWNDYYEAVKSVTFPNMSDLIHFDNEKIYKDSNSHKVINNGNILINNYLADDFVLDFTGENYKADNLKIESNWKLKIKTNNKNVHLVVENLDIQQGQIEIIDNGTLNLYVLDKFNFKGTINREDDPEKFNLFYNLDTSLKVGEGQLFNGGIYLNSADLELSGGAKIMGTIISNGSKIDIRDGSINEVLILAPRAHMNLGGGAKITGNIIVDHLSIEGNSEIVYKEYDFEKYPFDLFPGSDSSIKVGLDDIISTQSAIEP